MDNDYCFYSSHFSVTVILQYYYFSCSVQLCYSYSCVVNFSFISASSLLDTNLYYYLIQMLCIAVKLLHFHKPRNSNIRKYNGQINIICKLVAPPSQVIIISHVLDL